MEGEARNGKTAAATVRAISNEGRKETRRRREKRKRCDDTAHTGETKKDARESRMQTATELEEEEGMYTEMFRRRERKKREEGKAGYEHDESRQ